MDKNVDLSEAALIIEDMDAPSETLSLVALAAALNAQSVGRMSDAEQDLLNDAQSFRPRPALVRRIRSQIKAGHDPLGDIYCTLRTPEERRPLGQTYTPREIVRSMVGWAADQGKPERIVDPGIGSGRYLVAAAKKFPNASLFGADIDPLATILARANLASLDLSNRAEIVLGDYRSLDIPPISGPTLFIGNPPYVRHHQITPHWKTWLLETAKQRGLDASALAGLHVHFFLATAEYGRKGDYGSFITSSEWLDVNYGKLVRQLLLNGLGGQSLHVIEPEVAPFAGVATTGTITCFKIGDEPEKIKVRRVNSLDELGRLAKGRPIARERMVESTRWSTLTRFTPKLPSGYIELGELCRVHRGAVTGANRVWVQGSDTSRLPASVLFPSVTKARELFGAGERLETTSELRRVVDLPIDLDSFNDEERELIEQFLHEARSQNIHRGYVAANRKAWWSVGLREPAPILATYMARRPPAFVRNDVDARHINIAHGLYPREPMSQKLLDNLAEYLRSAVSLNQGRTYAGGLVKFEPREMERLPVPSPKMLL